jgi:hypothetical protein
VIYEHFAERKSARTGRNAGIRGFRSRVVDPAVCSPFRIRWIKPQKPRRIRNSQFCLNKIKEKPDEEGV